MSVAASCGTPDAGKAPGEREVARLYRLGLTMAEIAVIFEVSPWAVAARLDRAGMARRARGQKAGLLPVERAARRYRRRPHLLGELAERLGISAEVIAARAGKPPPRSRGAYRADVPADEVARSRPTRGPKIRPTLSLRQPAKEAMRVSRAAFYRWRRLGAGPPVVRLPGGGVRVRRSALSQWLRRLEEDTTAEEHEADGQL